MRTWRVGTFSMGLTLLALGVCLLVASLFKFDVTYVMLAWWPFILIVLGAEILLYLFKAKTEKPFLKYDILSIIFIGILGTVGIGFAVLQTTGLMDRAEEMISREHQTFDLPELNYSLNKKVERIVVETGNHPITIEGITSSEIAMFGSYDLHTGKKEGILKKAEDYVSLQQKGETVYVQIKGIPTNFFGDQPQLLATLLVPQNMKLEVNGNYNDITIKPRMLMSNWVIDNASDVSVQLQEESDVLLSVIDAESIRGDEDKWKSTSKKVDGDIASNASREDKMERTSKPKSATYQVGKGTNHLEVLRTSRVSLTNVK